MEKGPRRNFQIVERDGRLVVEREHGTPSSRLRLRLRAFDLPNLSWRRWGLKLFQRRHYFDLTTDGDAILSADSLSRYLKLDARSYDLYYISPDQQALLGWSGVANYAAIAACALFYLLVGILDFPVLLVVALFVVLTLAAQHFLKDATSSIAYQRYEPTEAESPEPEPAPSAPTP